MATYHLSARPQYLLRRRWTLAARFVSYAGGAAAAFAFGRPEWILDLGKIAGLLALTAAYGVWRNERHLWHRAATAVDVTPAGIRVTTLTRQERMLPRDAIKTMADLPTGGLMVISNNRRQYRSLVVPGDLDQFDACRSELLAMGIALTLPDPNRRGKLWAIGIIVWSFVGLLLARSLAIQIASGALVCGALLTMWAKGWTKAAAGQTCELPDRSPEAEAKSRRTTRLWGIALTAAGAAAMMAEAWWTRGTDDLGIGFFIILVGVIAYAVGFFGGTIGASVMALLALLTSAAAIGGLTWWLTPSSDLGVLIAASVALVATVTFASSLLIRSPKIVASLDVAIGPAMLALGVYGQLHGHDERAMFAGGAIVIALALLARSEHSREWLLGFAMPVRLVAAGVALAGSIGGHSSVVFPSLMVFWSVSIPTVQTARANGPTMKTA